MTLAGKAAQLLLAYQSVRRDFCGWDLSHITLHDVRLEGLDLSGAKLDHTYQEHTVFPGHETENQPEGSAG